MKTPKKEMTRNDEITKDFLLLMDKHFSDLMNKRIDRRFHSKDFAALLFIHPVHLTNTIKLTTGKSPCELMEERMLAEAQQMLKETGMSVAEIGYKFAYHEPTNFIKFFKGMIQLTPLQYRKSL